MNYIKEINAFYDWLELNELSKSAVLLWHALMHLNNKSGWQESFTVARSVIEAKTGLKKDAYYKARNQLKQAGLIDFKERGTKATIFKMNSFLSEKQTTNETSIYHLSEKQTRSQTTNQTKTQTTTQTTNATINKLNETKLNETNNTAAASSKRTNFFDEYTLCFGGQPTPIQIQEINAFIAEDGLSEEVVCLSFKKAAENGYKYAYSRSILNSWAKKGIKTIADVEKEQENYLLNRQQYKKRQGTVIRKELIPDWFDEPDQPKKAKIVHENVDAKKREIEEMLKAFDG